MLEHQKILIDKLSYDKNLFKKEIVKSIKWLKVSDLYKLFDWLKQKYWNTHQDIIVNVLQTL
jgi:hypothetical protein